MLIIRNYMLYNDDYYYIIIIIYWLLLIIICFSFFGKYVRCRQKLNVKILYLVYLIILYIINSSFYIYFLAGYNSSFKKYFNNLQLIKI